MRIYVASARFIIQPDLLLFVILYESYPHKMGFASWEATSVVCTMLCKTQDSLIAHDTSHKIQAVGEYAHLETTEYLEGKVPW